MQGVSYGTLNNLINEKDVPSERTLRAVERSLPPERQDAPAASPLDEWGATNARVMDRLARLLERDQVIIEMRTQMELLRMAMASGLNASEIQAVARQGLLSFRLVETDPESGGGEGPGLPAPPPNGK